MCSLRINLLLLLTTLLLSGAATERWVPQQPAQSTIIEQSESLPRPPPGTLGTASYKPTTKEEKFFAKLADDERTTGSMLSDYSINGKKGKFVGWFGIVRKIEEDPKLNQTNLLLEHKYFDGLTDTHILALSFEGGGDFTCSLSGTGLDIKSLSLVKAYGKVIAEENSIPALQVEYLRQWDWGQFTFLMSYGKQKGNKEWKKLNKAGTERIYKPFPDDKYYEERLGPRQP